MKAIPLYILLLWIMGLSSLCLLSEKGGDINITNDYGWSVLHSAARGLDEDWRIIKWLLKKGANPNVESNGGIRIKDILAEVDSTYVEKYDELVKESENYFAGQQQIFPKKF